MSRFTVDVDVSGVDSTLSHLDAEIQDAINDAADVLYKRAKGLARKRIFEKDAIFNREVWYSWEKEIERGGNDVTVIARNYAAHAEYVERGARFPRRAPPKDALRPWVREKLAHWSASEEYKVEWLQNKIKRDGLQGIHFARYAENRLRHDGDRIVQAVIDKNLPEYI